MLWNLFSVSVDVRVQKWEEHIRGDREGSRQPMSAAQKAWQQWAAVPRKARTVLKQANPESVAILELSYLQFMEDVSPPRIATPLICVSCGPMICCPSIVEPSFT